MSFLEQLVGPMNVIMTVGIYSLIIKDNVYYKWCETTMYAILIGYGVMQGVESIITLGWVPITGGDMLRIVFVLLGLLIFFRLSPEWASVGRIPMAIIVGVGATLYISGETSKLLANITGTMLVPNTFANIIIIVGTIGSLLYFLFTSKVSNPQPIKWLRMAGLYTMMIFFGVSWGNMIPYRTNLVIGRILMTLRFFGIVK
jgi:hypothetical protein